MDFSKVVIHTRSPIKTQPPKVEDRKNVYHACSTGWDMNLLHKVKENIGIYAQTHRPFDKQWKEVILHTLTLDHTEITSACTICSLIHGVYRVCAKCAPVKECKKPIENTDKVSKF